VLEANLREAGICRDPLVLWAGHDILLEGHLRLKLCEKLGIPYHTTTVELKDREAARRWVIDQQRGRRNLTKEEYSYYRGQDYNCRKQPHGGDRSQAGASVQDEHLRTAEKIAAQEGISASTVRRNAEYAEALDRIAEVCGVKTRDALLRAKATRTEVLQLAALKPEACKKETQQLLASKGSTPKAGNGSKEKAQAAKQGAGPAKPPAMITLPTRPVAFAAVLKERLGPEKAKSICVQLCKSLGLALKEDPPQQTTPPANRRQERGGKATAKAKGKRGNRKTRSRS
jgi:hypothetical protein